MNRRDFLKLGAASSAALTATSLTATLTGCTDSLPENSQWKTLRESDRIFLTAVAPVMLKGSLPTEPAAQQQAINNMLQTMDLAIFKLGPHNTKQLMDLFNLLNFGLSRGLTTGVWSKWENASFEDIDNFLNRWRDSSLGLFNLAFNGLNKLMSATWYGQPAAWPQVGYPGPLYPDILITKS
ncbi:MAG: twin-arginine translocation pathway signal protein [Gammaproteobacteria bacterium]|nr:twin-arginine translocation pathway signal protein [Gammaproteobacteria bacterium]